MLLFAQTGKISGRITDKETGEALPGANVILQGEGMGAASDADGNYVILNVTPGTYTMQVRYIGYSVYTIDNVDVQINRTTRIDIAMSVQAFAGEEVLVTAQRPIVEPGKTTSSSYFEERDISGMPVSGLRDVMAVTAGVNRNADGTISIRGGSGYDVSYSVNGMKSMSTNTGATAYGGSGMTEKSENSWRMEVNPLAVAQIEIITGGFNAEYGNAQSGMMNVVTKEGGRNFSGAFRFEYRPAGKYHWGDYLYSNDQPEWQQWGDLGKWLARGSLSDSSAVTNYNIWVRNHSIEGEEIYLYDYDPVSGDTSGYWATNGKNILGVYDYRKDPKTRMLFSFGGPLGLDANTFNFFIAGELNSKPTRLPTVEQQQDLSNITMTFSYKPHDNHSFKFTNMYQYFSSGMGSGSVDVRWAGLSGTYGAKKKYTLIYDALRDEKVSSQHLNYKYMIDELSFLDVSVSHQFEELSSIQRPTPGIDKDKQLLSQGRRDHRVLEDEGPWYLDYRKYYTWTSLYNQASLSHTWSGRLAYANQINESHYIKAGMEAWLMDQDYNASSSLTVSSFIWRTGFSTNYKAKTRYAALYLQDQIEFSGLIANVGLRLDACNFGSDVPVYRHDVFYPAENEGFTGGIGIPDWRRSKTFVRLSPRAGLSFPISDKTVFRVQYGHFTSMPLIVHALDNQTNHGWGMIGNPELEPQLSVNYEVGIQQNLWDSHQLDIVTYYNDLKHQVSAVSIETGAGSIKKQGDYYGTYTSYLNNSYGSSQGVEISFSKRLVDRWRYRMNYTLSQVKVGYHGYYIIKEEMTPELAQKYTYSASDYTAAEDRTHRFNASVSYTFPERSGPYLMGMYPLENMRIGLIYRVASGLAYYWEPAYVALENIESNRRYPPESATDLLVEKNIRFTTGTSLVLSLRISNLFNNKQLTPLYSGELSRWVLRSSTYMDPDTDPDRDVRLYNYYQTYKNVPREIYLTIGFDF
ncbi:MAG: TonB-dependent receptor [Candidatus Marinimicrobia bacterium]|nr:TonB-dependent receptor [Candidatus Neomarinimicrobiota bacterium]